MSRVLFKRSVFINCPFDDEYAPLLEAILFCVVYFELTPCLSSERLEAGENRLDKIVGMMKASKYSIHDLSRCKAKKSGEFLRMNMPFELGVDLGLRRSSIRRFNEKKFLILEENQYDSKKSLSDFAGQDFEHHKGDYEVLIRKVRDFFRVEAGIDAPGVAVLVSDYATFLGWMTEKKISQGHSEKEALKLPTRERLDEMKIWMSLRRPEKFIPN